MVACRPNLSPHLSHLTLLVHHLPPPGLDPDEYMTPTGPDMPGDIPGDPFTPGDFFTPGDSPAPPSQPDNDMPGDTPDNPFTPPPGPQAPSQFPPFPPAAAVPPIIPDSFLPLTPVQPDTPVVPTLVVPPTVPDEQMISPEKRPLGSPVSERPSTKARPARPVQMPASFSPPTVPPSNHLGGDDRLVFSPPVVQTPKPKKRKPEDDPPEDEEDAGDPDAQPSGHHLPIADDDEQPVSEPVSPESPEAVIVDDDVPDDAVVDVEEGEEDDVDSDETIGYNDLFVDENSWSWLSAAEQKLCSNTGSFTVPRYIDGSPVDLKSIPSHADFVTPSSYMAEKKRQLIRKNYADIQEVYSLITEEDKAFLTLYQSKEEKRKEATQQENRQFAKQFLEAKQAECKSWFDNDVFELVDMLRKSKPIGTMLLDAGSLRSRKIRTVNSLSVRHAGY